MKEQLMEVKGMSYNQCLENARVMVSEKYINADEMKSYADNLYKIHNGVEHKDGVQLL